MPEELPENKELETALLSVNGREFLQRLDWVRKDLDEGSNAWAFVTHLARNNPSKFIEYVNEVSDCLVLWEDVDKTLFSTNPPDKIRAVKSYRNNVFKSGLPNPGIKAAKAAVEQRMKFLGL